MSEFESKPAKVHRARQSGPKFEKRKAKKEKDETAQDKAGRKNHENAKAFSVQHVTKTARMVRRILDHQTKRYHVPTVDRVSVSPPPMLVALVGPPGCGKTTLLRSLVKFICKQKVSRVAGPITLVVNKKKRVTFIECNNDINCMIDVAKIADLVLLMVDASRGFEMPTFEFSNILHVHGLPRVIGVLNHLDHFKENKTLKKKKKKMKQRMWNEIGTKFFYLTKFQTKNDDYLQNEVKNLARFIGVKNTRPSDWRSAHPHVLVDRLEDITNPRLIQNNPNIDRTVSFFGYVRGTNLMNSSAVHIPGCGDFTVKDMRLLSDPCALPEAHEKSSNNTVKRRTLSEKERSIYAPMSGIGGVIFDGDATYIDAGGSHHFHKNSARPGGDDADRKLSYKEQQKKQLGHAVDDLEQKLDQEHGIKMLGDAPSLTSKDFHQSQGVAHEDDEMSVDSDEQESDDDSEEEQPWSESEDDLQIESDDEDEEMPISDPTSLNVESNDLKAIFGDLENQWKPVDTNKINWNKLVYNLDSADNKDSDNEDSGFDIGGIFRTVDSKSQTSKLDTFDVTLPETEFLRDWKQESVQTEIRDLFTTGDWGDEDAKKQLSNDEKLKHCQPNTEDSDEEGSDDQDSAPEEKELDASAYTPKIRLTKREKYEKKKAEHKALFDTIYDATQGEQGGSKFYDQWREEVDHQSQLNRDELAYLDEDTRLQLEGYRPGMYIRVEIENIPCELVKHFNPEYPIILGGLLKSEESMSLIHTRFLHHRWYKRILKSADPLVMSVGWRRFQTLPIYSKQEDNLRKSFLKYTPEHTHCYATFYGPIVPQKTGIVALQSVNRDRSEMMHDFRIAGTATVLETNEAFRVEKKLKLRGEPFKIFSKTAFVKGMFNSALEVSKFINAQIQTVSGIRGRIKQSLSTSNFPKGSFRAGFEAKIVPSDLVFCRCFTPVEIPHFYATVTNLLLSDDKRERWQGVRTVGQIRKEKGLTAPNNPDSHYKPIERSEYVSLPVKVPKKLQKRLPYQWKPKNLDGSNSVDPVQASRPALIRDIDETRRADLVEKLRAIHEAQTKKKKLKMRDRVSKFQKEMAAKESLRNLKRKEIRKKKLAIQGSKKNRNRSNNGNGSSGRLNPDSAEGVSSSM